MDSFVIAIKDIIRYSVVQRVNTGDKTLDNLINTFILAVMSIVFGPKIKTWVKTQWMTFRNRIKKGSNLSTITRENYDYYTELVTKLDLKHCTWSIPGNQVFTRKMVAFYFQQLGWKFPGKIARRCDFSKDHLPMRNHYHKQSSFTPVASCLTISKYHPLFVGKEGVVYLYRDEDSVFIAYENEASLRELHARVSEMPDCNDDEKNDSPESKQLFVRDHFTEKRYLIFPDRTLDMFVSRHKPMILNALQDFQKALDTGKSSFNGFGTYNLGFMLHGAPGTGKTSLIKAICNYTGRTAVTIDMKKVETSGAFEEILARCYNVSDVIFVFEEFDCVQGAIKRSSGEQTDEKEGELNAEHVLREEYMRLLEMQTKTPAEAREPIARELAGVKKKMEKLKSGLDIYTLLTVLDGVAEMRGRIIIATTNYLERIDEALLREGRFDYKINLGKFNNAECHELLHLMFKARATAEELAYLDKTRLRDDEFTPVQIINTAHTLQNLRRVVDRLKVDV